MRYYNMINSFEWSKWPKNHYEENIQKILEKMLSRTKRVDTVDPGFYVRK